MDDNKIEIPHEMKGVDVANTLVPSPDRLPIYQDLSPEGQAATDRLENLSQPLEKAPEDVPTETSIQEQPKVELSQDQRDIHVARDLGLPPEYSIPTNIESEMKKAMEKLENANKNRYGGRMFVTFGSKNMLSDNRIFIFDIPVVDSENNRRVFYLAATPKGFRVIETTNYSETMRAAIYDRRINGENQTASDTGYFRDKNGAEKIILRRGYKRYEFSRSKGVEKWLTGDQRSILINERISTRKFDADWILSVIEMNRDHTDQMEVIKRLDEVLA